MKRNYAILREGEEKRENKRMGDKKETTWCSNQGLGGSTLSQTISDLTEPVT